VKHFTHHPNQIGMEVDRIYRRYVKHHPIEVKIGFAAYVLGVLEIDWDPSCSTELGSLLDEIETTLNAVPKEQWYETKGRWIDTYITLVGQK
jgi:hypothetical protein